MGEKMDPLLEYRSIVLHNESTFLLNQKDLFGAYHHIHENFENLTRVCAECRDLEGRSLVSLVPFLGVMQRQGLFAFWSLADYQFYQAWVLLRPMLEACLIMGKFIDSNENAEIWKNRKSNRKAYMKVYQGKALESRSLPRSSEIRRVLSRLNDEFSHFNRDYYERHTEIRYESEEFASFNLHFFDRDEAEHRANGLAMIHLAAVMQDSIEQLWKRLYGEKGVVGIDLSGFEGLFRDRVNEFLVQNPEKRRVLKELGLWELTSS